ncbi:MAG: IPT/TIG domain-containing protein [Acidobacteria bacterium]|nr:IPT/TIG domain-containing protein [Acidobacteriota bacterium]
MIRTKSSKPSHPLTSLTAMMLIVITICFLLHSTASAQQGGTANYFYDSNGRLHIVLSPTGEAAIYEYDPAGNFTSITRRAATEVSIIEFSPGAGAAGNSVTIYGTGFSTTASENTVKFNGVTASVTSATKTQLVVTVPTGATTGPISVTTSNGTAASGYQFYVTSGTVYFTGRINFGESLIIPTSPSPDMVALINFDGVAGQRVSLMADELIYSTLGSPPFVTISLISPSSETVSSLPVTNHADLPLVPPFGFLEPFTLPATGSYTLQVDPRVNNYGVTIRLYDVPADLIGQIDPSGSPQPFFPAAPGQNARLTFNGAAGQRISLRATQPVATVITTDLAIIKPDGTNLVSVNFDFKHFIEPLTLPVNGAYTILVDERYNKTRPTTVSLYDQPPDLTGSLTIGGASVELDFGVPGQIANLAFNLAATQTIKIPLRDNTIGDLDTESIFYPTNSRISIINSSGTTVFSTNWSFSNGDVDNVPSLPAGNYMLRIDPDRAGVGRIKVSLVSQ